MDAKENCSLLVTYKSTIFFFYNNDNLHKYTLSFALLKVEAFLQLSESVT